MTAPLFNREAIRPGDLICRWTDDAVGFWIRVATKGRWNHDAIVVRHEGRLKIGDALMKSGCQLTEITEWERLCFEKRIRIIVLRPTFATPEQGELAAQWWLDHVRGHDYDRVAIWRLGLKWLVGDWLSGKVGLESNFFCTEGVRDAWQKGGKINPWWPETNPTPGTTFKRFKVGTLVEVMDALTEAGRRYAINFSR